MTAQTGFIEITVADRKIGLRFGMNFWQHFTELHGQSLEKIGSLITESNLKTPRILSDMIYCAALAYCEITEQKADFTRGEALSWFDEIDQQTLSHVIDAFTQSKIMGRKVAEVIKEAMENQDMQTQDVQAFLPSSK